MLQSWWIPRRCVCNRCPFDCALSFPVFYCVFVGTIAYTLQNGISIDDPRRGEGVSSLDQFTGPES